MKRIRRQLIHLIICTFTGGVAVIAGCYLYLNPQLPSVETFRNVKLQAPLRIYSQDGTLVSEYGSRRRIPKPIDQIPKAYIQAVLAIEDKRFYQHSGVDFISLVNAMRRLLLYRQIQGGASTITMQVARNISLSRKQSFLRKFKEILLALKMEQELTKKEILELYLNLIPFGKHAYGAEAAALTYYDRTLHKLSLPQLAMLAGIPQAPSAGNPINNPKRAVKRRNLVLIRMLEQNNITDEQYQAASNEPITADLYSLVDDTSAPWFSEVVRLDVVTKFGQSAYEDGYRVYTTLDLTAQKATDEALRRGIATYDLRHGYRGSKEQLAIPDQLKQAIAKRNSNIALPDEWRRKLQSTKPYANLVPAVVAYVDQQSFAAFLADGSLVTLNREGFKWARRYLNANSKGQVPPNAQFVVKPSSLVWLEAVNNQWFLRQLPVLQGAALVLSPKDGAVRALTGGSDFTRSQFNHALQAKRQPGSSFKPFIYASALEKGVTPATIFNDAPIVFDDQNLEGKYRPRNSSGVFRGPTRVREAFYRSINLVSMRILLEAGIEPTLELISRFGFSTKDFPKNLQLALGGGTIGVTPIEMARSYTPFANGGYLIEPYFIERIEQNDSGVIFKHRPVLACNPCQEDNPEEDINLKPKSAPKVIDDRIAFQIKSFMQDVIKRGTGRKALALGRTDLAGKTGTTNDADVWFNGFNNELVASVWLGFSDHTQLGNNEFGSNLALPVWADLMSQILPPENPEAGSIAPPGLVQIHIDPTTGKTAHPANPAAEPEWFRTENAPPQQAQRQLLEPTDNENGIDPAELF